MIVAERKPLSEIMDFVRDYEKIMILGCGTCTTVCLAGGEAEVKVAASGLRIAFFRAGKEVEIMEGCVTRQCEPEFLDEVAEKVNQGQPDAVVSLGCGVGVNFLAQKLDSIPVFPGVNTKFFGGAVQAGVWMEMCAGCGNCILHLTGGICPLARCSKSILNGPCGGSSSGKCEISPDIDCGWSLIIERMKKLGTLDRLEEIVPPSDWSTSHHGGPRKVIRQEVISLEEEAEQEAGEGLDAGKGQ
ncbi:MAG: methylenetetrahydrofolate reductase C-terminal domain-containing protein [Spirochaetota bacterium]